MLIPWRACFFFQLKVDSISNSGDTADGSEILHHPPGMVLKPGK